MKVAVITGASSGMGREAARMIDRIYEDGIDEIWLIARRLERLQKVADVLQHKSYLLPCDLSNESDFAKLKLEFDLATPEIVMLVNAAGFGIVGDFADSDMSEQDGMIKTNCEALVKMTHLALPFMPDNSRIINFASSAAFVPQAGFSIYAATKSFVLSFSRSLNTELSKRNISVTAVCPGPVETEFFDIAEKNGTNFKFKKLFMAKPEAVVSKALYDSYKRNTMSVYGLPMQAFELTTKLVPHDAILYIMKRLKK